MSVIPAFSRSSAFYIVMVTCEAEVPSRSGLVVHIRRIRPVDIDFIGVVVGILHIVNVVSSL